MLQFWDQSQTLRCIVYLTTFAIGSELCWRCFKYVRTRRGRRGVNNNNTKQQQKVAEVIWTNEMTFTCESQHSLDEFGNFETGQFNVDEIAACDNAFCFVKKINRMVKLVDETQHSIDIAMYTFTSLSLTNAFLRAIQRGVMVRIISDKEMCFSTKSQIFCLNKAGAPMRCPISEHLMHHKFCIFDGAKRVHSLLSSSDENCEKDKDKTASARGVLLTGSCNWTRQGLSSNWDNMLLTSEKLLIEQYELEFERLWNSLKDLTD